MRCSLRLCALLLPDGFCLGCLNSSDAGLAQRAVSLLYLFNIATRDQKLPRSHIPPKASSISTIDPLRGRSLPPRRP